MLKLPKMKCAVPATTIVITTIGVLLGGVESTLAQQSQRTLAAPTSQPASSTLSVLEDAFWACDYVATTRGASDIPTCTAVYEALNHRKFAGDFDALVSWWRQNKAAQHKSLRLRIAQAISKSERDVKGEPS
ncbi:MAG: hypothetical protein ACXW13_01130 [Burkholderiaceae bacterium]